MSDPIPLKNSTDDESLIAFPAPSPVQVRLTIVERLIKQGYDPDDLASALKRVGPFLNSWVNEGPSPEPQNNEATAAAKDETRQPPEPPANRQHIAEGEVAYRMELVNKAIAKNSTITEAKEDIARSGDFLCDFIAGAPISSIR